MSPEPIDEVPIHYRAIHFFGRVVRGLLYRARKTFGLLAQSLQQDELRELSSETRILGSAASESIAHVGAELREMNERLSALERDVDRISRQLGDRAGAGASLEGRGEASPQPLSTD